LKEEVQARLVLEEIKARLEEMDSYLSNIVNNKMTYYIVGEFPEGIRGFREI